MRPRHSVSVTAKPEPQSRGTAASTQVYELGDRNAGHRWSHRPSATTENCTSPVHIYHNAKHTTLSDVRWEFSLDKTAEQKTINSEIRRNVH